MPPEKVRFELTEKQTQAWDVLDNPKTSELLYGGAKGGGKSVFFCMWVYQRAKSIMEKFHIPKKKFPVPVGFMGRKRGVDFSDTTLETWKKFIPEQNYRIREQEKEIILEERVKLIYGGFDDQKTIQKFNSAEYGFFGVDQAEEISRDDVSMLRGSLRLKINGKELDYRGLFTANPRICWLKDEFISAPAEGKRFIPALPSDNPFLPKGYIERLRDAFKHRPELLEAYLYGNWDELEGVDLVMTEKDVRACVNRILPQNDIARLLACDVARFGDDETVIYLFEGNKVIWSDIYQHRSITETAGNLWAHKNKRNALMIASDVIGEGAGVVDILRDLAGEKKSSICAIDSREKPTEDPNSEVKFLNRRAEIWWKVSELVKQKRVSIPDDPVLIGQLSSVRYFFSPNGRIKIESKDEIKKRLLKSPDRADAFCYGIWAILTQLPKVKIANRKYLLRRNREEEKPQGNPTTGY